MKVLMAAWLVVLAGACASAADAPAAHARADACIPAGYDPGRIDALKTSGFEIADAAARQAFAKAITACLASPDPALRDGLAFEALSKWARAKQLSPETMKAIVADLEAMLEAPDPDGFAQPFAALVLSEMARADRIEPYLSADELVRLLVVGQHYLINVSDYRGFDENQGWRHGVAHAADLMMQLALNPRIDKEGLALIRSAIGVQIAPRGHAYVFGESERLARPILMAARRGVFSEGEWSEWLADVSGPGDAGTWDGVYASPDGLARKHNLTAFLSALWVNVSLGEDATDDALKPGVEAAIRSLP